MALSNGGTAFRIQRHVPVKQTDRPLRGIHGVHGQRSPGHGIYAESSGVAEQVEHPASGRIFPDQGAVVPLVQEESGLLAVLPVHDEAPAVLEHRPLLAAETVAAIEIPVNGVQTGLERHGSGALVIDGEQGVAEQLPQGLANPCLRPEHAYGMRLEHADPVIPVDYQAGQAVALPVHEPETAGSGRASKVQAHAPAHIHGLSEPPEPEVRRQGVRVERKHAHGDGTYLVMSGREIFAFAAVDGNQVALGGLSLYLGYRAAEHPGMETSQRLVTASFQYYLYHSAGNLEPAARVSGDSSQT